MKGNIVIISTRNNEGKPRPCIIVQSDWLNKNNPPSYIVCPLTTEIYHELKIRPIIHPDKNNNLKKISQVMTDKIQAVRSHQFGEKIGEIDLNSLMLIENSLRNLIDL